MNPLNKPPHEVLFTENKKDKEFALGSRKEVTPEDAIDKAHRVFAEKFHTSHEGSRAKELYKVKKDAVRAFDRYLEERSGLRKWVDAICSFLHISTKTSRLKEKKNAILDAYNPSIEKDSQYHEYRGKDENKSRFFQDLKKDWGHFLNSPVNSKDLPPRFQTMFEKGYPFEALLKKAPAASADELLTLLALVTKDPENKTLAYFLLSKASKSPDFQNALQKIEGKGINILLVSKDPMKKELASEALSKMEFLPFNQEWLKHIPKEKPEKGNDLIYVKIFGKNVVKRDPYYLAQLHQEMEAIGQKNMLRFFEDLKNPAYRTAFLERNDVEKYPLIAKMALKQEIEKGNPLPLDVNKIVRILNLAAAHNDLDPTVFKALIPLVEKDKIELSGDWKSLYETLLRNKNQIENRVLLRQFAYIIKNPSDDFLNDQLFAATGSNNNNADIESLKFLFTNFPRMRSSDILYQKKDHIASFHEWVFSDPQHFNDAEKKELFTKLFFSDNLYALEFFHNHEPQFGVELENLRQAQFLKSSPEAVQLMFVKYIAKSEVEKLDFIKEITGETDPVDRAKALLKTGKNRLFDHIFPLLTQDEKRRLLSLDHGFQNSFLVKNYAKEIPADTPLARQLPQKAP